MDDFEKRQICQEVGFKFKEDDQSHSEQVHQWVFMEIKDDNICKFDLIESASDDSLESSSSLELMEDASSSSSSSSCSPLFELSELMAQLPIKRGLSKFYQGKSESFASLTSVKSIQDLEKKGRYSCKSRRSMKTYGQSQRLSPKATIAKNKKASPSSSSSTTNRSSIFSSLGNMSSLMAN